MFASSICFSEKVNSFLIRLSLKYFLHYNKSSQLFRMFKQVTFHISKGMLADFFLILKYVAEFLNFWEVKMIIFSRQRCWTNTCNATENQSHPTISSSVISLEGKENLPIPRIPVKLQITLLHLGLCLIGKDALAMTGEPVGNGADGRFCWPVCCGAELCCDCLPLIMSTEGVWFLLLLLFVD